MNVTTDYRGVNVSSGVKSCLVFDKKVKQEKGKGERGERGKRRRKGREKEVGGVLLLI